VYRGQQEISRAPRECHYIGTAQEEYAHRNARDPGGTYVATVTSMARKHACDLADLASSGVRDYACRSAPLGRGSDDDARQGLKRHGRRAGHFNHEASPVGVPRYMTNFSWELLAALVRGHGT
jgi:hypothetical protein